MENAAQVTLDHGSSEVTCRSQVRRKRLWFFRKKAWMKRRILLVDDEVAVLLTLKAVLEISGFDVDTAASAREGKLKLRKAEYAMVITDMRMESESAGVEVVKAARAAASRPAVALLTAFPTNEEGWQYTGADKMLVKPMQTRVLLQQLEKLLASHEAKKAKAPADASRELPPPEAATKTEARKAVAKRGSSASSKKPAGNKAVPNKPPATKHAAPQY